MDNPYFIEGSALISFSGGRSSAMMLKKIIDAHGGALPDDVYVAFANTGKEREETLRFVYECGVRWGVKIHWLEFVTMRKKVDVASRFEIVGLNSASRNGEPLSRLIKLKSSLFSTLRGRWCTEFCKVGVTHDFMASLGYKVGEYTEVIGFRADEYDRVVELPARPRNVSRRFAFPLAKDGVRKGDVKGFWQVQGFDLELQYGGGNCDHCPFLSDKSRIARARANPDGLDWWDWHEKDRDFSFGYMSIEELRSHINNSPLLPMDEIEADAADSECGAWCERQAA